MSANQVGWKKKLPCCDVLYTMLLIVVDKNGTKPQFEALFLACMLRVMCLLHMSENGVNTTTYPALTSSLYLHSRRMLMIFSRPPSNAKKIISSIHCRYSNTCVINILHLCCSPAVIHRHGRPINCLDALLST